MDVTSFTADIGQDYALLADFTANATTRNHLQLLIQAHESVELAWSSDAASPFYTLPAGFTNIALPNFYPRGKIYARVSGNENRSVTINIW